MDATDRKILQIVQIRLELVDCRDRGQGGIVADAVLETHPEA